MSDIKTPRFPGRLHTPPAPRFGHGSDFVPYTPRKSTRLSAKKQQIARTPSPDSPGASGSLSHTKHNTRSTGAESSRTNSYGEIIYTFSLLQLPSGSQPSGLSPESEAKKILPDIMEDITSTTPEDSPKKFSIKKASRFAKTTASSSMGKLPTPAKTPQKAPASKSVDISTIARNIFPAGRHAKVEDATPKSRKSKKYTSFPDMDDEASSAFPIYTDTQNRVPEVDLSDNNPFYLRGRKARVAKRHTPEAADFQGSKMEEASAEDIDHEDGLVYVFRGKKVLRKFSQVETEGSPEPEEISGDLADSFDSSLPDRLRSPLTRSSLKPRLLFPSAKKTKVQDESIVEEEIIVSKSDEEAATDIEDDAELITPTTEDDKKPGMTPSAPRFGAGTPPTTARATRSQKLSPMPSPKRGKTKNAALFSEWRHSKSGITSGHKHKREVDSMEMDGFGESSKRARKPTV